MRLAKGEGRSARAAVARAELCRHSADAAETSGHSARLAGALALSTASIVLQFAIPHEEHYDFPFTGILSARILVQWVLATIAASA